MCLHNTFLYGAVLDAPEHVLRLVCRHAGMNATASETPVADGSAQPTFGNSNWKAASPGMFKQYSSYVQTCTARTRRHAVITSAKGRRTEQISCARDLTTVESTCALQCSGTSTTELMYMQKAAVLSQLG
jgi:hypothetical protein